MEFTATTTFVILSYLGPILGIIGFIITPGFTVIYPWLREKVYRDLREQTRLRLDKNYSILNSRDVISEGQQFMNDYKWDWRYKIFKKKREIRKSINKSKLV